jgi:periplasmic protein TonB
MPRDLFGDVTRPSISIGNRKWYTVPVSLLSHSVVIAMFVVLPILAAPYLPQVIADNALTVITELVPPTPPLPPRPKSAEIVEQPPRSDGPPIDVPTGINPERPAPEAGWEDDKRPTGTIIGDFDTRAIPGGPPPPPVPQEPVRIGGTIRQPLKVRNVDPVYPAIAQAARVQGIVIIEATLSPDGRMSNARILRSIPLLDQAALEAVRQWEYTPTLLNGVPVPVIMTITVMFTLSK